VNKTVLAGNKNAILFVNTIAILFVISTAGLSRNLLDLSLTEKKIFSP